MLEGLAAWILNTYVGEYLENLNTDQLSIGLLQGEVELENLPLRKDALKGLDLPVEVHAGFVGKIKLQIPVSRLRSEPWVIFIEKLFLIAGPVLSADYDETAEEGAVLSRKLAKLEILEAKAKGTQESKQCESYYSNWMGYGTSLMANIIENVQLKIKDVHIRYEDNTNDSDCKFACGIVIHSLSAQSTDQDWVSKFVRRDSSDFMWKLLQLQGMSFYWDTKTEAISHLDQKNMMSAMAKYLETCVSPGSSSKSHEFILAPVNAEAHLTRNCSVKPLRSRFIPRIICDIHLQKIPLSLSEVQYKQIMGCAKRFEVLDIRWKHRKWRPKVPVKNNARQWWTYAISVHLDPIKKQNAACTWSFAVKRAHDIVAYTKVYQEYMNKLDLLSPNSKSLKESLEKKLSFELLCVLREIVTQKIRRESSGETNSEQSKGKSFLQWMFPSWGGWYSSSAKTENTNAPPKTSDIVDNTSRVEELKSQLEEEILDVLDNADNDSLLKRDTVFAQLNFSLSQGSVILLQNDTTSTIHEKTDFEKSIIELEFSNVSTKVETRPRTGSFLFEIKLGALYLHDRIFTDTHFPLIIAPQNRDVSFLYSKTSGVTIFPLPSFLNQKPETAEPSSHLFELSYEKKPFNVAADHKLIITTRALDVVYNQQLLKRVNEFFFLHHDNISNDFSVSELKLTTAARARYEVLKQQTKAELQHKWDQILDGEDKTVYSRGWNIEMNISAPQIIIPEDICDKQSSVVVFDLGKLHFYNACKTDIVQSPTVSEDLDDDDDFITPCSTPQELQEWTERHNKLLEMMTNPSNSQQLKEQLYEKYILELSNIQVLVSRLKDNWKFAQLRGTSTMHILDRFSITIQTERRMVYTQDPEWPSIAVTGNLPKLVVHVSEQKVNALQTCVDLLKSRIGNPVVSQSAFPSSDDSEYFVENLAEKSFKEEKQIISKQISDCQTEGNENSLLFLMEFCIDQMSFDVQSRGHSVAELQVTGVKTTFSKYPHNLSLTLCVHSLLLVDALQTFGPDFELLLASHKHLSMDSKSGSLRDSEPNSPASPGSPPSPISSPQMHLITPTPPSVLSAAINTLQSSTLKADSARRWSSSLRVPKSEHYASDALIIVEFNLVESLSAEKGCTEVLQIASLQFNNLDVIANQETIVELVEFGKRIAFHKSKKNFNGNSSPVEELNKSFIEKESSNCKYISRTEITFDFHRLNILLLRAVSQKNSTVGQKVATATVTGARIQATIGDIIEIQGSLGGLQVLDLITENTKHQKIVSIGYDPLMDQSVDWLSRLQEEIYKPVMHSTPAETDYALTFSVIRGDKAQSSSSIPNEYKNDSKEQGYLNINLRMASLCYTHSPRLLHELSSCATEFKMYMRTLASSIKSAATEMAMGIVSKRTGSISATLHGNQYDSITPKVRLDSIDDLSNHVFCVNETKEVSVDMKLDILLQTPVVAIPTSPHGTDVLVAHLGRIAIQNQSTGLLDPQNFSIDIEDFSNGKTLLIEVRDMNMHFVNLEKRSSLSSNLSDPTIQPLSVKELYACDDKSQLIIHDTVIEIVAYSSMSANAMDIRSEDQNQQNKNINVQGRVVNPLKVVLTKQQFQQMLKVFDNLTYIENSPVSISPRKIAHISNKKLMSQVENVAVSQSTGSHSSVGVSFELPDLIVELRGDLMNREEGIVSLTFQEFILEYKTEQMYEATLNVTLQTLLMEDLRNLDVGSHCYLMSSVSNSKPRHISRPPKSKYISVSCPNLSDDYSAVFCSSSSSLPDKLNTQNMFSLQNLSRKMSGSNAYHRSKSKSEDCYPSTPPPSPTLSRSVQTQYSNDALVSMNINLIDKSSPLFNQKYHKTHHFIDIDFNCLDILLNLQTWVMVLDFFSFSSSEEKVDMSKFMTSVNTSSVMETPTSVSESEATNSEISLKVKSLTVVLNKPEYKLASANISNFTSDMSLRDNTYSIKGTLGSISVSDLSPHGSLYPEKFITTGTEALHYDIFKYSDKVSGKETDYDLSVKCQMSSVQYVHTQRFLSEITAFFQHFNEMQELIRKIRLATSGAILNTEAVRGSRILLDIAAGSPVIVIPQSSQSQDVLVADLGKITVRNMFLTAGSKGTISFCKRFVDTHSADHGEFKFNSMLVDDEVNKNKECVKSKHLSEMSEFLSNEYQCLLDVINVELTDMDLYSAVHIEQSNKSSQKKIAYSSTENVLVFPSFTIKKQGNDLLQQKFMLQVQVERNLDSAISHIVPDWAMEGVVSSVYVTLDKEQYSLVLGILGQNLGESLEEFTLDPCNESEQFILMDSDDKAWTTMAIHMDLVNVTLELLYNEGIANNPTECSLAKFDFIRSRLCYESFSDNSKDIDLVSNMVQVSDVRYKDAPVNNRPNVFIRILQPIKKIEKSGSTLQAEVHYRVTNDFSRFTVLLNNMRIMGIYDFLQSVLNFLTASSAMTTEVNKVVTSQKASEREKTQTNFEMKINVTDTELVVVEDTSLWDSNAVIMKTTAVITWKPDFVDKPLSCSLQSLEVFSCILGAEDDTALSIVDPLSVSLEIIRKANSPIIRLESSEVQHFLEISAVNISLRLSYYDMTMFIKIFESIKKQITYQHNDSCSKDLVSADSNIDCLVALGFESNDCKRALVECRGNVNDAALWLTQNASPKQLQASCSDSEIASKKPSKVNVISAEIRITSCSLCIIDDCRDADIPVAELNLSDIMFVHKFSTNPEGSGNFNFNADYYNRALSGWEPVIEPWKCCIKWKIQPFQFKPGKKVMCSLSSVDIVNFNITSSLIELYKTVKKNWTEDYFYSSTRKDSAANDIHSPGCYRRRLPFMPFALKNNTGCKLWFSTQITTADRQNFNVESEPEQNKYSLNWTEVAPGNLIPVPFESRSKIRHKDSHAMKLHQIIVKVDGWLPVAAVSVDRVGTYFRYALPQKSHSASIYSEKPSAKLVFNVALEGSAQKLITVESALVIENRLEDAIELKLENTGMQYGIRTLSLYLVPNEPLSIPLQFVHAQIWARPVDKHFAFCNHSISWHHVTKPGDLKGSTKTCSSIQKTSEYYRFLVLTKRRKFSIELNATAPVLIQPAHKLYLLPCLEIINLLPYDLHYCINNLNNNGYIRPGKNKPLHGIDVSEQFSLKFFLENFKRCKEITLSASARHYPSWVELCDSQDRLLVLQLRILYLPGGALKLFVSAPYWLVNKTGLPLVFKQEGTNIEAAGQMEEHELARCMAPLLFSFADREASAMCNMRVGKSLHRNDNPQWCYRFDMEKGVRVRRLHVTRKDGRPDWVYNIGIDVRVGRGRYSDTHVVTLSPRYQLDNRTSHKLEFCQLFATKENREYVLSAMSKSSLPFHWPRIDLDNLLCVRQPDIVDCNWSGGFAIDNIQSFHINMRDSQGKSNFLRVEIILQNATFFIVFTDADRLPSPFRIDNQSDVPITYYQTNVEQERLKTSVRPHSSVPYAFDEPTLPPYITCLAPGGSAATYNMNIFREGNQLFYENFIYVAFTGTFDGFQVTNSPNLAGKEYVLDVPFGNKVVINKREAGKRSQLWRMTSTGMLQHEGSSPPRDPHKPNSVNPSKMFVLDIAALSPQPGEYTPLTIRKPDPRRQHTQTWKFTYDGRLCCGYPNMFVQSKDGFKGLRRGNEVVLGPSMPVNFVTMGNGIPMEQAIFRKKLRGGSGVLTVKVIPDGPTRVLLITDIKRQQIVTRTSSATDWVVVEENQKRSRENSPTDIEGAASPSGKNDIEVEVFFQLSGGLGISIVNHLSEELVYILLHNIMIEYTKTTVYHSLCGSIKDIQVDNQLREVERPVTLFVSQSSKSDDLRHLPALHFTVQRICTPVINAEIFKHLIVTLKNLTIMLEERLLLKLLQFAGLDQNNSEVERTDESENNQSQRSITETMAYEKRYYFSTLKLCLQQIKLSVLTSSNLQPDLLQVKRHMRLRLIRFEDATIELDSFVRIHPFETAEFLVDSIVDHYKAELKNQAAKILGAVDFLGNPLGLMNDVSDGLSKLFHEGNVRGLIKNVTHGLSDSAAKLSGSLSDGIGIVTMDDKHQKRRKEIRQQNMAANDHLMAGLKGLGLGLVGGITSVFTQTYEGAAQEGVQGFFSGLGKGLVGTVAKPTVGILDFASGAASAVRDTSKGNTYTVLSRTRPPRTCVGPGGLLPRYSHQQALGQDFLYNLNNRDYNELFIAKEQIRSGSEDLHALISSEQVYFLSGGSPSSSNVVLTVPFSDLYKCCYVCSELGVIGEIRHYLQLIMKAENSVGSITVPNDPLNRRQSGNSLEPLCKKPQVRCDSEEVAKKVVMQINYAKSLHEERTYMVLNDDNSDEDGD